MLDTMHCLQLALVPEATGETPLSTSSSTPSSCAKLEDKAFRSHAGCYVDNGLCTLDFNDWVAVLEIVNLRTLFESSEAFKATMGAAFGCAQFAASTLLRPFH